MNKIISKIPNTITLCNLLSGCVAIIMAFKGNEPVGALPGWEWCCVFIFAAAVFDFFDGFAARLLKAYSEIGRELDSLADLVSFGVAPGLMIFNIMQANTPAEYAWLNYAALTIPAFGALRLARFNVADAGMTTFRGLPIPANAMFWIGLAGWINSYRYPDVTLMVLMIVLISMCMVSRIPMFSLKFKTWGLRDNFRRYVILIAAVAFVAIYGLAGFAWTIVLYLAISLFCRPQTA